MVIAFFGHSNYITRVEDKERLINLFEEIIQNNQVDFYLGGYGGFDNFVLECTKKYKERHKNTNIVFVTPYLDKWLNKRKDIIQQEYDFILYPELEYVPQKFAILKRNEWMVNQANYVFAYVETHFGGAYRALLYAHKQKKPYINLYQGSYELY